MFGAWCGSDCISSWVLVPSSLIYLEWLKVGNVIVIHILSKLRPLCTETIRTVNYIQDCDQLTEKFAVARELLKTPLSCDSFRRMVANIRKLFSSCLLAQSRWRPNMWIHFCVLVLNKNIEMLTVLILYIWPMIDLITIDVNYSILYQVSSTWITATL